MPDEPSPSAAGPTAARPAGASPIPGAAEPAFPEPSALRAPPPTPEELERRRLLVLYLATGASALLFFASFRPIDLGLVAWFSLVPWLFFALRETRRAAMVMSYSVTFLGHLLGLGWIALVTPEGWLMTTFLEGFYSVAIVLLIRWMRPRTRLPVMALLPPLWVAAEFSRGAHLAFIKFPWLLLGQTQHERSNLIQLADVTSVYGLSFLVALVNGLLVDVLLAWSERRREGRDLEPADLRRLGKLALVPAALLLLVNVYGFARVAQVQANVIPGPRILAVQCDIPQDVKEASMSAGEIAQRNLALTRMGLLGVKESELPDAVVWTETTWLWPLNVDYPDYRRFDDHVVRYFNERFPATGNAMAYGDFVREKDQDLFHAAEQYGCDFLIGSVDQGNLDYYRDRAHASEVVEHNCVYQIGPKEDHRFGVKARYDKINLVPASEGIPGQDSLLFGWFYKLLKGFVPPGFTTFEAGKGPVLMTVGRGTEKWRISPDICFEVSFPELLREGVREGADVLVCPSNDGWFHTKADLASAEIDLAYDHARLRAIETRRGMVRVVNRGITCFIDPLGTRVAEVTGPARDRRGQATLSNLHVEGTILDRVPTTRLTSFYVLAGDLFAWLAVLATAALVVWSWRFGSSVTPGASPDPGRAST